VAARLAVGHDVQAIVAAAFSELVCFFLGYC
jgi:hypothetical protein